MNKSMKNITLIIMLILIGFIILKFNFNETKLQKKEIKYSEFLEDIEKGNIKIVNFKNNKRVSGILIENGKKYQFETFIPFNDPELVRDIIAEGIKVEAENPDEDKFINMLLSFLPWIIALGVLWFFMIRQVQSTGNKAMSFGKSRAKMHPEIKSKVTFADVAGVDEAKNELAEVVDFLKNPDKFIKIGAKIPKGVLLMGAPGTGKTLLARAIAGEADVKFYSISGSDFVEMFVGVGASRVRDLFEQGKKNAPCIVFIDEIDAVGRLRGAGLGGGHDEREQTLNQLLVEMDGFEMNEGVIIIAATNRPDVLDPALLRPGRFDRQVVVDVPDVKGREKILAVHSKKVPLEKKVSLKTIAKGTPGFTGADLANLVNEAALLAARKNKKRVTMIEMEEAKDKVYMGPERKSMLISDEEKKIIAYHEAGHAIVGLVNPGSDVVHKVTIIPRGRALGVTWSLPKEEKHIISRKNFLNRITQAYGGYVAEEIVFKQKSSGASNDIKYVTAVARQMVCEYGMSDKLGPVALGEKNEQVFLGKEIAHTPDYSEATAKVIDDEIQIILRECKDTANDIIKNNYEKFEKLALYLIERETLIYEEIQLIMEGKELPELQLNQK